MSKKLSTALTDEQILKLEPNEIILKYQNMIHKVIKRKFPSESFLVSHGLEYDDLVQFGNLGILQAVEKFDSSIECSLDTYIYRNIYWKIYEEQARNSKIAVNKNINNTIDVVSADVPIDDNGNTLVSLITDDSVEEQEAALINQIELFLKQNGAEEKYCKIIRMRIKGYSYKEIAEVLKVSPQAAQKYFTSNKKNILLNRKLQKFLRKEGQK